MSCKCTLDGLLDTLWVDLELSPIFFLYSLKYLPDLIPRYSKFLAKYKKNLWDHALPPTPLLAFYLGSLSSTYLYPSPFCLGVLPSPTPLLTSCLGVLPFTYPNPSPLCLGTLPSSHLPPQDFLCQRLMYFYFGLLHNLYLKCVTKNYIPLSESMSLKYINIWFLWNIGKELMDWVKILAECFVLFKLGISESMNWWLTFWL